MQRVRKFKSFQRPEPEPEKNTVYTVGVDGTLDKWRREWAEAKIESDRPKVSFEMNRRALLDLFPRLNIDDLKKYAMCRVSSHIGNEWGLTEDRDYEVIDRGIGKITVINDKGVEKEYADHWFKPTFKKYDFEVYVRALKDNYGITKGKKYRLIGETNNGYEIRNNRGMRQNISKNEFGFPELN